MEPEVNYYPPMLTRCKHCHFGLKRTDSFSRLNHLLSHLLFWMNRFVSFKLYVCDVEGLYSAPHGITAVYCTVSTETWVHSYTEGCELCGSKPARCTCVWSEALCKSAMKQRRRDELDAHFLTQYYIYTNTPFDTNPFSVCTPLGTKDQTAHAICVADM